MLRPNRKTGFALTELIVVIAILGIILAIGTLNFSQWMRKAQVESVTREFYTDLNTARTESIYRKKRHAIVINATSTGYIFKRYSSQDESPTAAGTPTLFSKNSAYPMKKASGASAADRIFEFDIRGFTYDLETIQFESSGSGAAYDCVVIHTARTNLGKMEGGSCVQK